MSHLAMELWTCSWQATVIAAIVLLIRAVFRGTLSPAWRCGLWAIVLIRLLVPTLPASTFSLFGVTKLYTHFRYPLAATPASEVPAAEVKTGVITRSGWLPPESDGPIVARSLPAVPHGSASRPLTHWLAIAWLAGVVIFAVRLTWTNYAFARRLSRVQPVFDGPLFILLHGCCAELGMRHAPALLLSDAVSVPALAGVVRPRILLPAGMALSLSTAEARLILLHELYHLKRRDLAVDWVCTFINVIHWFNPLLWIAATAYRSDRELLRDAMVLRTAGADSAERYGLTILKMAERPTLSHHLPLLAAFSGSRRHIHERVQMIAGFKSTRREFSIIGLLLVALVGCSTLTSPKAAKVPVAGPPAVSSPAPGKPDVNEATSALLASRIPELTFNNIPLTDALDQLRDITHANLFVNWAVLEKAGISRQAPVNARMRDISLGHALTAVLNDASGGTEPLGYLPESNVISITTRADIRRMTMSTRTYDIRDLLVDVPDFEPALNTPGGLATTKPGVAATRGMTREERVEAIIRLIKETVEPDSWREGMNIKEIHGQLVVSQSAEGNSSLELLFSQLRQTRALQVVVDTKFVLLDPWAIRYLGLNKAATTQRNSRAASHTDTEIESLLHSPEGQTHIKVITAPRVALFNGQRGYALISTQRTYISGYTLDAGRNQFEPKLDTTEAGLLVDLQTTISSDRKYVTVTLRPRVTRLDRFDEANWLNSPADHPLKIQRPVLSIRELRTTVSIPDQQTLVVGGFEDSVIGDSKPRDAAVTLPGPTTGPDSAGVPFLKQLMTPAGSGMELFVFVRPTIVLSGNGPRERMTPPSAEASSDKRMPGN